MRVVVHGATGAQGKPVATTLAERGVEVVPVSRSGAASTVRIDLSDPSTLAAAYRGADGVFFHFPLGATAEVENQWAANVAGAARSAGVRQMVVSTSGHRPGTPAAEPVELLVDRLRAASITTTVVASLFYLENLLLPPVLDEVRGESELRYPLSDSTAIAWTSHLDVADITATAFQRGTEAPALVWSGHLPPLRGADLAAGFSAHAGRPIRFVPIAPTDFGHQVEPIIGAQATKGVVAGYEAIATAAEVAFPEHDSAAARLDLAPRSVAAWLDELKVSI